MQGLTSADILFQYPKVLAQIFYSELGILKTLIFCVINHTGKFQLDIHPEKSPPPNMHLNHYYKISMEA